jgi:hypothetical protein
MEVDKSGMPNQQRPLQIVGYLPIKLVLLLGLLGIINFEKDT